ncbi:MAG: hypothetical protein AB7V46_11780 [Thermomicrobiales bacterium]
MKLLLRFWDWFTWWWVIFAILNVAFAVLGVYIVAHFVSKYW